MAENGNGRGHVQTLTTTAAAIFNLGAIVVMCFVVIPMMLSLSTKMERIGETIESNAKVAKRLNDVMDANEARMKALKKDGK